MVESLAVELQRPPRRPARRTGHAKSAGFLWIVDPGRDQLRHPPVLHIAWLHILNVLRVFTPSLTLAGGFSQGGAIALFTAITGPHHMGDSLDYPVTFPMVNRIPSMITSDPAPVSSRAGTRVFIAHGTNDPLVKHPWAERSVEVIQVMCWNVDFRSYKCACPVISYVKCICSRGAGG